MGNFILALHLRLSWLILFINKPIGYGVAATRKINLFGYAGQCPAMISGYSLSACRMPKLRYRTGAFFPTSWRAVYGMHESKAGRAIFKPLHLLNLS